MAKSKAKKELVENENIAGEGSFVENTVAEKKDFNANLFWEAYLKTLSSSEVAAIEVEPKVGLRGFVKYISSLNLDELEALL